MRSPQKKLLFVFFPYIVLSVSLLLINFLSKIKSDPLDSLWPTRQLVIGLFVFSAFSFIPRFLQLSFRDSYPWVSVNLSHHSDFLKKHELVIKDRSICTGCVGSSISILLANGSLLFYFFLPSAYLLIDTRIFFITGFILVLLTYSRYFATFTAKIRLIQHSALFLGISFLIIAEDIIFQSALFFVLLLPSWISFLLVRVKLSEESHRN